MKGLALLLTIALIGYSLFLMSISDKVIQRQLCLSAFSITIVLERETLESECISYCVKTT